MSKKCTVSSVATWLVIVGAINWGLVGISSLMDSNWNVVNLLLGNWSIVESIVYILVGASAVVMIMGCKCKTCTDGACASCGSGSCSGDNCK